MKKRSTNTPSIIGKIFFIILISQLIQCTKKICDSNCIPPPSGLISWWPGDCNANDIVGNNNGTLEKGATFAGGKVRNALSFDHSSYVQAPTSNLPTGNSNRTLMMWVKINSFNSKGEAFFAGYGTFGDFNATYHLGTLTGDSTLFFSIWGPGFSGPKLHTNRWYHIAVANVGDDATLYLNGTVVATGTIPINTPSGSKFYIGRIPKDINISRALNGLVDEVQIFNRALDASEIEAIFKAGSNGECRDVSNGYH